MRRWKTVGLLTLVFGFVIGAWGNDAVLLRLEDDIEQVRVEALDEETDRWLAIASGYKDKTGSGWLKVALPEEYLESELRVIGNANPSPFLGKLNPHSVSDADYVAYPPTPGIAWADFAEGGGARDDKALIEEADIWTFNDSTLYFYNQYRGLQVLDLEDPDEPVWLDYFRYPAKGEDLYAIDDSRVLIIGTGSYWSDNKVALKFIGFDGTHLNLEETVELEAGYYMDSRRYNDYLYVMTREWVEENDPDGNRRSTPLIRLYTVALSEGVENRLIDVQTFQGNGWLDAVLTAQQDGILLSLNRWYDNDSNRHYRWRSEVNVLVPGEDGVPVHVGMAPLSGIVQDKFKLNYNDGLLTAVSQKADWSTGQFSRATRMENFSLGEDGFSKVGEVDLAPGETLFATRFYEDTVYIVTFLFVDPLFAIDNSDPSMPLIAGELEVPGWSNYIEWVDDQLFAVGIEDNRLTVSIFDVDDPTNMSLKDRVFLNEDSWAYSEAQYDDQAISFFPDRNLLMLPFTTWSWESSEQIKAMQLISWDEEGLQLRGSIQHIDTPRRGTLLGDSVVTVSGRELLTSDISNPDLPLEGGQSTLAWNVQTIIPHEGYLLQLETSSNDFFGYWRWEYPYGTGRQAEPVLYVTSKDEPNIPAAEVVLGSGRLLEATHAEGKLYLLQDISEYSPEYWELPDRQSIVIRAYDLTDPLAPVLTDEVSLEDIDYLGEAFEAHHLPDGSILWASAVDDFYGYYYLDFWPGPWFYQRALSYLVTTPEEGSGIDILNWKSFNVEVNWGNASRWFWEPPLLLASMTEYIERQRPEGHPEYQAKTELLAVDFSDPGNPLELPSADLPANLVEIKSLPDGMNHYLYFEPQWNAIEVWAWDEAVTFQLFEQELYPPEWSETSTYSQAWMPPFHARQRSIYDNGNSTSILEIWRHDDTDSLFEKIETFAFEDTWFGANAVLDPYYLQSTNDTLHFFRADENAGTFSLLDSVELEFPNVYSLQLGDAVMADDKTYIPAGLYGVEVLPFQDAQTSKTSYRQLSEGNDWVLLDESSWEKVSQEDSDEAGMIHTFNWLFYPDSMSEIDAEADDEGDFWRNSAWFGWYVHDSSEPQWIYHMDHGSIYAHPSDNTAEEGLYLTDSELGILWTREDTYPWIYAYDRTEWLYYLPGSGQNGRRWFYGLDSGWF